MEDNAWKQFATLMLINILLKLYFDIFYYLLLLTNSSPTCNLEETSN